MADLGNLWFTLGLDDSKFKSQWDAALKKYDKSFEIKIKPSIDLTSINKEIEKVGKNVKPINLSVNYDSKAIKDVKSGLDSASISADTLTRNLFNAIGQINKLEGASKLEKLMRAFTNVKMKSFQDLLTGNIKDIEAKELDKIVSIIKTLNQELTKTRELEIRLAALTKVDTQRRFPADFSAYIKLLQNTGSIQSYVRSLTSVNTELAKMRAYYGAMIRDSALPEASLRQRLGIFREYIQTLNTMPSVGPYGGKLHKDWMKFWSDIERGASNAKRYINDVMSAFTRYENRFPVLINMATALADIFERASRSMVRMGMYQNTGLQITPLLNADNKTYNWDRIHRSARIAYENLARMHEEANKANRRFSEMRRQVASITPLFNTQSKLLTQLRTYASYYVSVFAVANFVRNLVRVTGEFDLQKTALAALIGSANSAVVLFEKIKTLSVESPFQFSQLTSYIKQMAAFGIPLNDLYDTTKRLADVSAGLGVDMQRIILAYGQVRSAEVLRGQEIRQFTEAGLPILELIAKKFTEIEGKSVSVAEVFDRVSKRMVPFSMIKDIFKDLTSEGGRFFNMQEVQAKTVKGEISNLKDAYEIFLYTIGSQGSGVIKGLISGLRSLLSDADKTIRILQDVVAVFAVFKVANFIAQLSRVFAMIVRVRRAVEALNIAMRTNIFGLIAAGIAIAVAAIREWYYAETATEKINNSLKESLSGMNNEINIETQRLKILTDELDRVNKGSEDYYRILNEIKSTFPEYVQQLEAEGIILEKEANLYEVLSSKIKSLIQNRYALMASEKIQQTTKTSINDIISGYFDNRGKDLTIPERMLLERVFLGLGNKADIPQSVLDKIKEYDMLLIGPRPSLQYTPALKQIEVIIAKIAEIYKESDKAMEQLSEFKIDTDDSLIGPVLPNYTKWQEIAMQYLKNNAQGLLKVPILNALKPGNDQQAYYKSLRDRFNELKQLIADNKGLGLAEDYIKEKNVILGLFNALKISADELKKGGESTNNETSKIIQRHKDWANEIIKIRDAYRNLMQVEGMTEERAFSMLQIMFPGKDLSDFDAQLQNVIKSLLKLGTTEAKSAANDILFNLDNKGMNKLVQILNKLGDTATGVREWKESISEFETDSLSSSVKLETIIGKYTKGISDANSKVNKFKDDFFDIFSGGDKQVNNALKLSPLYSWQQSYSAILDEILKKELSNNKKIAIDRAEQLASTEANRLMENIKLDVSTSGGGVNAIISKLRSYVDDISLNMNNITGESEEDAIRVAYLSKLKKILENTIKELNASEFVKSMNGVGEVLNSLSRIDGEVGSIFSQLSKGFSSAMSIYNKITKNGKIEWDKGVANLNTGDKMSMAASAIGNTVDMVNLWISRTQENKRVQEEFYRNSMEYAHQYALALNDTLLNKTKNNTAFIRDYTGEINDAFSAMTEAMYKYQEVRDKLLDEGKVKTSLKSYLDSTTVIGSTVAGAAAGLATGAVIGSAVPVVGTVIGAAVGLIGGLLFGWGKTPKFQDLKEVMPDIVDASGELNVEMAKALVATDQLDDNTKQLVQNALDWVDATEKAEEAINSIVEELAGSLGDDLQSALVSAWEAGTNAAMKMFDVANDSLSNFLKQLTFSAVFSDTFNELRDRLVLSLKGDGNGIVQDYAWFFNEINKLSDVYFSALDNAQALAQKYGFNLRGDASSDTSSSSISANITEDTANRIGSYINGIRSDVSVNRVNIQSILPSIDNINSNISLAITIWQQMEANTRRSADGVDKIIRYFDSMMSSYDGGSGMALKVNIAS